MRWLFSFDGRIGRAAYAAVTIPAFLVGPLVAWIAAGAGRAAAFQDLTFWFIPARWLFSNTINPAILQSSPLVLAGLVLTTMAAWIGAAAAVRRSADAGGDGAVAAFAITPVLQVPAMLWLAVAPPARATSTDAAGERAAIAASRRMSWRDRLLGLLVAVLITLGAVALGAFVFRSYGYAMFISTPLLIGGVVAFISNRHRDLSPGQTLAEVSISLLFAGLALLAVALEGLICILMAAPLAWIMAAIGGAIGRPAGRAGRARKRTVLMSLGLLPAMFVTEQVVPAAAPFEDSRSVVIEAGPEHVWPAVLQMRQIEARPAWPFRLGLAYPVRGEVIGEGIGATRLGHFSTGTATERVTEWAPGRALGFDILSEPPTLKELSPYADVHAPHVEGYFRSVHARLILTPLAGGRTRLTLDTSHELSLQPSYYWMPMARWVVRENKARVLAQMKAQAEQSASAAGG